jgi:hypothetical protein
MKLTSRLWIGVKALSELGAAQLGMYGLYRLELRAGYYQHVLDSALSRLATLNDSAYYRLQPCLVLPGRSTLTDLLGDQITSLYEQADEIVNGKTRIFGGPPVALELILPETLEYWTKYEGEDNQAGRQDIKFTWEPARFGWACTLARAFYLSRDEKYADAFWNYTERFLSSNPPYLGPHWTSSQEVAIRLVSLAFTLQAFTSSKRATSEKLENIARAIAIHAERIPPTMLYARSQNNNHLITEALGLYTASALLPDHPLSAKWHRLGWKWLKNAFLTQIDPDGTYTQHSTNYHRLMLQAALWMYIIHDNAYATERIPPELESRLSEATKWLWQMLDPLSGRVPNLGHNDGGYILPLTICPYYDYRPIVYAAVQRFLHSIPHPGGAWNEMAYWLCPPFDKSFISVGANLWNDPGQPIQVKDTLIHSQHNPDHNSWALFRIPAFHSRPAHADLLHVDLWWRGLNLAQDPGTYLYNSTPPWDNSLTSAFVHNTITVDGQDFMRRAGRFLYLDWAQARAIRQETDPDQNISITAAHNGYRKLGVVHSRKLTSCINGNWEISDHLTGSPDQLHTFRLHWLLPDWEYEISPALDYTEFPWYVVRIRSPFGWVSLNIGGTSPANESLPSQVVNFQMIRAGKLLYGSGQVNPISGWASPTYGYKIPALACLLEVTQALPIELKSLWILPNEA